MIELRPFAKLGSADHGWLKAKHHFSFGSHYDPDNMGHGSLRVWNDDEIAPNTGFPAHPHANMEIITYVREGAITHQDSLGNKGRTEAGDVQVMSAGSAASVTPSTISSRPTTRIFQIWIEPTTQGGQPTWGAKPFPKSDRSGKLRHHRQRHCRRQRRAADPRRRAGARHHAEGRRARGIRAGQDAQPLSGAGGRQRRGQRRARQRPRRRRDPRRGASSTITALEDSELVLVDAA